MNAFSIHDLAQACRVFLDLAYPEGPHTIPDNRRPYCDIPTEGSIGDYLPPAPLAAGVCQDWSKGKGDGHGYELRLGSAGHPHLKLRIQPLDLHEKDVWIFSVDTHDRFLLAAEHLDPAEAQQWRNLVEQNRKLKHQIEEALSLAGFMTPTGLLRIDLTSSTHPG